MLEKCSNQFVISKTSITSFLHCELCNNHITILPIWIDDPLHCSGMIEAFESKKMPQAQGAPAPVFFLPVSFLVLCHQPLTAALSSSFFASLLCHNRSPPLSAALSHAVLYRAAKKSAATSPALFKPCLFLFQKSQLP